jgi:hypothetical protein
VSSYLSQFSTLSSQSIDKKRQNNRSLSISSVQVVKIDQDEQMHTNVLIKIGINVSFAKKFNIEWHLVSSTGQHIAFGSPQHFRQELLEARPGEYSIYLEITDIPLGAGRYFLDIGITRANAEYYDKMNQAVIIDVPSFDPYHIGWSYMPGGEYGFFTFRDRTWIEDAN